MLGLFNKKLKTLEEHLNYLVKKPKLKFQLDIYRNNQVDFQIFRQSMLNILGVKEIKNPNGLACLVCFNSEKDKNKKNEERFKESTLFTDSLKIESDSSREYVLKCENNYEAIAKLINRVQVEIYDYNQNTVFSFAFSKHN